MLTFFYAAPGTYSPEKVNLDKGPQYSLTGRGTPEKLSDNPGENHLDKSLFPRRILGHTLNTRRESLTSMNSK